MKTYTVSYDLEKRTMTVTEMAELYTFAWLTYLNDYEPAEATLVAKDIASKKAMNYTPVLNNFQNTSSFEVLIEEALEVKKVNPFWYVWRKNTPEELQLSDMPLKFVQFLYKSEFEGIEHDPDFRKVMHELISKRDLTEKLNACRLCDLLKPLTFEALKSLKSKKIGIIAFSSDGVRHSTYGLRGIEYVDEFVVGGVVGNDRKQWVEAEGGRRMPIYSCPAVHHEGEFVFGSDDQVVWFVEL